MKDTVYDFDSRQYHISRLIKKYEAELMRLSFLYLHDYHLAQDAVQDTFMKAYINYSGFRGDASERTWLTRIAINTCKNYAKRFWSRKVDFKDVWSELPSDDNTDDGIEETVMEAVMKLQPKYREVILLYYYQEMKVKEISAVLEIPISTVTNRLARARERLKKILQSENSNGYEYFQSETEIKDGSDNNGYVQKLS